MSLKYLLDTNILSEAKRLQPSEEVMSNLRLYNQKISIATRQPIFTNESTLTNSSNQSDTEFKDSLINQHLLQIGLFPDYDVKLVLKYPLLVQVTPLIREHVYYPYLP